MFTLRSTLAVVLFTLGFASFNTSAVKANPIGGTIVHDDVVKAASKDSYKVRLPGGEATLSSGSAVASWVGAQFLIQTLTQGLPNKLTLRSLHVHRVSSDCS